jgi:hypothetical protein
MLDAMFQFRRFPLNFCLHSEARFPAFQILPLRQATEEFDHQRHLGGMGDLPLGPDPGSSTVKGSGLELGT